MLFVHDQDGEYRPAPKELVLTEANKLSGYQLRRGAKILSAETAKSVIGFKLRGRQHEVFACIFLDCQHRILAFREMFAGTINHTTVHPREIVKAALYLNATAVILAHNHPSGGSKPSQEDILLTRTLTNTLKLIFDSSENIMLQLRRNTSFLKSVGTTWLGQSEESFFIFHE